MKRLFHSVLLMLGCVPGFAADPLEAFPPADPGMTRYVIALPPRDNESDYRIELAVGKIVNIDAQNRYFFGGRLARESIEGWGYERYVLRELGPLAGTRMAVDPGLPKADRFIAVGGEPDLLRYNSRLPVVVYVPDDVEVRYRIWRARTPRFTPAPKG